jgi:hypothetical protein
MISSTPTFAMLPLRLANHGQIRYDWRHYVPLLERKPGALRNGAPFADLPEPLQRLRQGLLKHEGGDRVMARVLASIPQHGLEAVRVAIERVLESGVLSAEHVENQVVCRMRRGRMCLNRGWFFMATSRSESISKRITNKIPDFFTCPVNVKASEEEDGQVDHEQTSGYHAGLAAKSAAPVPLTKIVSLDAVRFGFGLNQEIRGNQFGVSLPMIGKENTDIQSPQAVKHFFQGFAAPVPAFPIDELTGSAAIGLPDPNFLFFDPRKCHISSSSMTTAPWGVGFS